MASRDMRRRAMCSRAMSLQGNPAHVVVAEAACGQRLRSREHALQEAVHAVEDEEPAAPRCHVQRGGRARGQGALVVLREPPRLGEHVRRPHREVAVAVPPPRQRLVPRELVQGRLLGRQVEREEPLAAPREVELVRPQLARQEPIELGPRRGYDRHRSDRRPRSGRHSLDLGAASEGYSGALYARMTSPWPAAYAGARRAGRRQRKGGHT